MLALISSLKPDWQKAKRRRQIQSEIDRVKRERDSKGSHERKRSADGWIKSVSSSKNLVNLGFLRSTPMQNPLAPVWMLFSRPARFIDQSASAP